MMRPVLVGGRDAPHACAPGGWRRVIVADDEAFVRRTVTMFLARAGWETMAVERGDEALDLLGSGLPCDLLVTDQSMPGLTGFELITAAARLRPSLPVLLVTGYDLIGDLKPLPWRVPVLRKPVGRAEFMAEVERLTQRPACITAPARGCGLP